jgi:acetolactate synthase-1/2/3 large subunit
VLNLQADGSAAYSLQSLWTQAREQLNVTTIVYANRAYRILQVEYTRTGAGPKPGPQAQRMFSLTQPQLDWVQLAQGMGVQAARASNLEEFNKLLAAFLKERGPNLIEAVI